MPENNSQSRFVSRILLALLFGLAGFAGNWFRFPLFFNVDLLFGSIFVMLALQICGLSLGLLAAVVAASATWIIWNHPYALIFFSCELLVTGLLYRRWRGNLMLANTAYWLLIGMPLVYFFYSIIMNIGNDGTFTIMFKQAINGISNTIMARLAATAFISRKDLRCYLDLPPSFRERLTTLLAMFVMISALILLALVSRRDVIRAENQIVTMLGTARRQTELLLATTCHSNSKTELKDHLLLIVMANKALERVSFTLYAPDGSIQASSHQPPPSIPDTRAQVRHLKDNISCLVPELRDNISVMERWKRSIYLTTIKTPDGLLVIQTAMDPWLTLLYSSSIQILLTALLLFLVSLIPGIWISNRICQPLQQLGDAGSRISEYISNGKYPDWPDSSIPEVARVSEDLRLMTDSLAQALHENQASFNRLQVESSRRELLEEQLVQQREHERLRISRELHDDIGQSLQAIKLNIQLQLADCSKRSCPGMELMSELINNLEQTVNKLRDVVSSLRQSPEPGLGLPEALQIIAEKICYNKPIQCTLQERIPDGILRQISEKTRNTLYYIAQEAITNAVRHSGATAVKIRLSGTTRHIRLLISDNGSGGANRTANGSGMAIMQERAMLAGGRFKFASIHLKGTIILVEVPFNDQTPVC